MYRSLSNYLRLHLPRNELIFVIRKLSIGKKCNNTAITNVKSRMSADNHDQCCSDNISFIEKRPTENYACTIEILKIAHKANI